jgi:anti-anti-sigma factor
MEAFERPADGVQIVALSGELDASDTSWTDELDAALKAGVTGLVIDMTNVTFIDSSVVRAAVIAVKRLDGSGWVRLVYTHHLIGRVLSICGLAEMFPQYGTVGAALRDAPTRLPSRTAPLSAADAKVAEGARNYLLDSDAPRGRAHTVDRAHAVDGEYRNGTSDDNEN